MSNYIYQTAFRPKYLFLEHSLSKRIKYLLNLILLADCVYKIHFFGFPFIFSVLCTIFLFLGRDAKTVINYKR